MPLNPEEVVNKRFSPTKFRQGYDEEEVDEFLDEVVAELRRLNTENEELRAKLRACEGRVAELSRSGGTDRPGLAEAARMTSPLPVVPPPAPVPVPVAAPMPAPVSLPGPLAARGDSDNAAGMLALAQKLHDEHVEAGKAERAKIVNEAQDHASRLVREAEAKQRATLGNLDQQRIVLERKVEQLRSFEREYRSRLKAYLEGQLRELEAKASAGGAAPDGPTPAPAGATAEVTQLPSRGGFGASPDVQERQSQSDTPRFPFGG
jgi:DivIVA domain-containing protein